MSTLETVARTAAEASLEFIVCGGFAVNAYQVMRKTGDIDLVVRECQSKQWKDQLSSIGYTIFHESGAFVQLRADSPSSWPIDLILVDDATFDGMKSVAKPFRFGNADCLIPSLEHLVAMKLHAIRSSGDSRMRQDALDIIDLADAATLTSRATLSASSAIVMATRKFVTEFWCMPESRRAERPPGTLNLPVPTRPLPPSPAATVEMMLAASAEMLPVWNADPENEKRRLARKSGERFRLAESPAE